ncbi:hypothetical protein GCM10022204_11530 [Microlunatus aurantiacus]|uniref:Major facilitator superfamily (MFS) profile domain-containing protein n=1 Tax=Microlunatus aurantiacus TaxID=446786 RepID=A0ABP7CZR1_9ACTN
MSTAATPPPENPRRRGETAPADQQRTVLATDHVDKREVVRRQRERFGGMKFGACFFGWLTATGTAVLLTALLTAAGAALGLTQDATTAQVNSDPQTIGLVGGIALLVVVLLAYFCGGYVAGRMARFNGVKQGIGVWLWALIVAVVVALLSLIAGSQFNLLASVNGFPRIPINEGTLATGGIIAAIVLVAAALIGAVLGGLAGMRFHRRVDHADLSTTD